jgi:hypothetical protein
MAKKDPRHKGKTGQDLINYKYQYIIDHGVPPKYAQQYRKNSWDKIEGLIQFYKQGELDLVSLNPKLKKRKTKGPNKAQPKNITPGYHWRKGYTTKTGKWVPGREVKNPTRRTPEPKQGTEYPKIMVFYKDQTEQVDGLNVLQSVKKADRDNIKNLINGMVGTNGTYTDKGGSIGKVLVEIANSLQEENALINKNPGYTLIYNDIPKYKPLLNVLATLGEYIYQKEDKISTAQEIGLTASLINPKVGNKLLNDIGL